MKRIILDIIGAFLIFFTFKLFSLGSNYEGIVIVALALIYWNMNNGRNKQ